MHEDFTVLVADDEKHNRTLLTELLGDRYRIILAKSGVQALTLAQTHAPDLILLDIVMPEMDGFETIKVLKEDPRTENITVIFISGLTSPSDEEKGLLLGAVDYITKPFRPAIVHARIRNHLTSVLQRRLLEHLAMIDGLTAIPNRRRFDEVYAQEWRRCQRSGSPLSLLVIDVDHFKHYNDTFGHAAGDTVLKQIASCLKDELKRPADFVARYGGEEFVVLLPEIEQSGAIAMAERLRAEVEALDIAHRINDQPDRVTISIGGITTLPATAALDDDLFKQADAQLFEAKRRGKNRICWAA